MMAGGATRRTLLGVAGLCIATAVALAWQHAAQPGTGFVPDAADVCVVPSSRAARAHPWDPASGLGKLDARPAPADARCPVCGMYPARHPAWVAQVVFSDGSAHFFDSPVDLFVFMQDPARFDGEHGHEDIARRYVIDHRGGHWIALGDARFVLGSNARGPMRGPDLPAFATQSDAETFVATHGGKIVTATGLDVDTLARLRDVSHPHGS